MARSAAAALAASAADSSSGLGPGFALLCAAADAALRVRRVPRFSMMVSTYTQGFRGSARAGKQMSCRSKAAAVQSTSSCAKVHAGTAGSPYFRVRQVPGMSSLLWTSSNTLACRPI